VTKPPVRSIICPDCGKLISSDEKTCPWCGATRPGMLGAHSRAANLFGDTLDVVWTLPIACIVLFVLSLALDPASAAGGGSIRFLLSPGDRALALLGMTGSVPAANGLPMLTKAPWWTVVTAIYLHGGLLHIVFNVMWIRQLGPEVDRAYGSAAYFVIFTVGGVVGFVLSNAISGAPTIGASGSIFGLLAALIVYGRQLGSSIGSVMSARLWQWAIILFILGFVMRGVNNYAHFGGFVGGWVAATAIGKLRPGAQVENRTVQLTALACLALTLFAFGNVAVRLIRSL
jgi:rhomboid protease GluP